jgi:hypothetical protein
MGTPNLFNHNWYAALPCLWEKSLLYLSENFVCPLQSMGYWAALTGLSPNLGPLESLLWEGPYHAWATPMLTLMCHAPGPMWSVKPNPVAPHRVWLPPTAAAPNLEHARCPPAPSTATVRAPAQLQLGCRRAEKTVTWELRWWPPPPSSIEEGSCGRMGMGQVGERG